MLTVQVTLDEEEIRRAICQYVNEKCSGNALHDDYKCRPEAVSFGDCEGLLATVTVAIVANDAKRLGY